jgi:hypothetical protein
MIQSEHAHGTEFPSILVFQNSITPTQDHPDVDAVVRDGSILDIDATALGQLRQTEPYSMTFRIPSAGQAYVDLELVRVEVVTPDYQIRTNTGQPLNGDHGVHYRGIIKDNLNSLAAISIFENEVVGFFADEGGNNSIGKLENNFLNQHIVYEDANLIPTFNPECGMPDDGIVYKRSDIQFESSPGRVEGDCVRIFIEVDDDIYSNKGSNTENFVTGFFNQSATLYANESIDIAISEIYVWTTSSPYTGTNSSTLLSQFQGEYSNTNTFNGDLAHLISYDGGGGIAAGFSGLCNSTRDNSMCFSGISSSYANVPTFSWTVQVFTHEMGHLFGSRHTHACVWNGNGTAIDGCYTTEGSCSSPSIPSGGGTIMSYCHTQNVGINFNYGFGTQPGNVIRNSVANVICLSSTCDGSGVPTCDDGVQNGAETGVDCGGITGCPPCACNDNQITIYIDPDTWTEETSWDIRDGNGNVVASNGPFGYAPGNTPFTDYACVINGCFDFTIYDSYGDGLFDGTNTGSYNVTDAGGNVLASGSGNFGASQTTNFCVNGTTATCSDGIQNQGEIGVDCGGPCDACITCSDGIQNQGETGVDCGGPCDPCPTCSDGIQNQGETGVDCGGPCDACTSAPCTVFSGTNWYWDSNLSGVIPTSCGQENGSQSPYQAWTNEGIIIEDVNANTDYNFNFCSGYNPATWEASITLYALTGNATDGWTIVEELGFTTGCFIEFNTGSYTNVYAYVNDLSTACDAANVQDSDNGIYELYEVCPAPATCDTPTGLGFEVLSNTDVTLKWDAVTTGMPVNFYKVRYRQYGTPTWTYQQTTNTSLTVTGLAAGEYYEFRVQTNCGNGILSDASEFERWTMTVCQSPDYSSIVATLDPCAPRNVTVSWTAPSNATVVNYKILYREPSMAPGTWQAKYTNDGNLTTKLLSQLELDTWYKVRVKTWCAGNEKSFLYSGYGEFTTLADNSGCRKAMILDGIQIFPNPASNILNVNYEILDESSDVQISIMDMTGRNLQVIERSNVIGQQREPINIKGLGTGYFFVNIRSNGETVTRKFAVVR